MVHGAHHQDHYVALGVGRNASLEDIKKAYRRLALLHHPDVNGGDKAAVERFRRVSTAYKVLSDRASRADYDAANAFAGMSRRTRMTGAHNFGHRMREAGHRGEPGTPHFDADAWNASQFAWSEGERMDALRRRMERAAAAAAAGGHSQPRWDWHGGDERGAAGASAAGRRHAERASGDRSYRAWAHGFYRTAAVRERSARQWGWVGVWICVAVAVITLSHGRGDLGGSGDPAWAAEATRQALAHEAVAAAPPPPRRREGRDEGRHGSGDPAARFDTTRAAPDAR